MSDHHENAGFIAPEATDLAPFFPGYEIQGLIATGGMGAVYCALQKSLDRRVALKILPKEFSKDATFCAGFESEAKAMARLNHPNLIGVYDFGAVNGMLYIMMEFVPGKSLYHSAHGIAIDPSEVIRLVTGVCRGLAHAHENGIIHRDIKPSNILLDLQAQPKIGDFGLASPIGRAVQEGEIIYGTPHYTAPEVVDSPHSVDYRADIFSVGVLLHELLTGKLPSDDPRPASTIVRCDPRFDTIIRRATQPIPATRYSSANQIAADLQVISSSLVPMAPRTAAMAPARRVQPRRTAPLKAKKASLVPLIVMLIVVVASIAAVTLFSQKAAQVKTLPAPKSELPSAEVPKKPMESKSQPEKKSSSRSEEPDPSLSNHRHKPEPDPNPDSLPKFEPQPPSETNSDPDKTPEISTRPDPVTSHPTEAKFDVSGFFERARKIMHERAKPYFTRRDESLAKNINELGNDVFRAARRLSAGEFRDRAERNLHKYIGYCKERDNRIPRESLSEKVPGYRIQELEKFNSLTNDYIKKEKAIDELLHQSISQLSATYILGLEKQIERLKSDNDPVAIQLIQEEIGNTRSDATYFQNLMTPESAP